MFASADLSAQPTPLRGLSSVFQELVERVNPSVVQVITREFAPSDENGGQALVDQRIGGSGVVVDAAGYVVTNAHVVSGARSIQVLLPQRSEDRAKHKSVLKPIGKLLSAKLLGLDRETDIALLKIDQAGLPHLRFADSESLKQGQIVLAFGSPFGLENSVTMGVIGSVARQIRPDDPMIYLQTDASINPGNSGGPLVDADGAIAGINTFLVSQAGAGNGVGFAVPSNIVRSVYEQIRRHGRVRRGQIGVVAQTITPELAKALELAQDWGVLIADVTPGGAAEAAGIEIKDIVLAYNTKTMENARQFGVNIYQNAGETVTIELLRGKEKLTKQIAVLERPKDPERLASLVSSEENQVAKLGVLAVDIDERVSPLLLPLRKLSGVVVAGAMGAFASREQALRAGDVIYGVNNTAIKSLGELRAAVQNFRRGEEVAVQIERLGQLQFLLVEIE